MKILNLTYIVLLSLGLCNCASAQEKSSKKKKSKTAISLEATDAPFDISGSGSLFFEDVSYGKGDRSVLDFFMPADTTPSPLVVVIHGGGFVKGNKEKAYESGYHKKLINQLLSENVSVATINYHLLQKTDTQGIMQSIKDGQQALQFLRYHARVFNIDKSKVVLMGSSAGAGMALWIGLNNEMADMGHKDVIKRESTRVSGLVCTSTQATYNIANWSSQVFDEYIDDGFTTASIVDMMDARRIQLYVGMPIDSPYSEAKVRRYGDVLDMLAMISPDDPEMYVINDKVVYQIPTNTSELYHHPLHGKALKDKVESMGGRGVFVMPQLGIDTSQGESIFDFVMRVGSK